MSLRGPRRICGRTAHSPPPDPQQRRATAVVASLAPSRYAAVGPADRPRLRHCNLILVEHATSELRQSLTASINTGWSHPHAIAGARRRRLRSGTDLLATLRTDVRPSSSSAFSTAGPDVNSTSGLSEVVFHEFTDLGRRPSDSARALRGVPRSIRLMLPASVFRIPVSQFHCPHPPTFIERGQSSAHRLRSGSQACWSAPFSVHRCDRVLLGADKDDRDRLQDGGRLSADSNARSASVQRPPSIIEDGVTPTFRRDGVDLRAADVALRRKYGRRPLLSASSLSARRLVQGEP